MRGLGKRLDWAAANRKGELPFWARRYWEHTIRDAEDFRRHCDYIHFNPVKHGLVCRVCDWPYSTFAKHVATHRYPRDWGGEGAPESGDFGEPA